MIIRLWQRAYLTWKKKVRYNSLELSNRQRQHWEQQLEDSKKAYDLALFMLGKLTTENQLSNIELDQNNYETNTEVVSTTGD